jgi:glycosyltransferase involved in cell wall biosynthesis
VNVLMVTPHLPPYQAANALLPHLLGEALAGRGHGVEYLTFGEEADTPRVGYVRRRRALRATRLPQVLEAFDTWRKAGPRLERADVVHVHSSTWMNQVAARLAARRRRPYVLTHYGTEIWHHDGKDRAFRRFNAEAGAVAFYSQALLDRARELSVPAPRAAVVYPPVPDAFRPRGEEERRAVRARFLAAGRGALLLNVKRLHPLADQATLLRAFAELRAARPDDVLLVAGSGEERERLVALAAELALGGSVRFLGLVPNDEVAGLQAAADVFVLSSVLEATPTVALEALASGTPVVSTDNPGGVELGALFGDDVRVVPKGDPSALARALAEELRVPRRTRPRTAEVLAARFRLDGVAARYLDLYREALAA